MSLQLCDSNIVFINLHSLISSVKKESLKLISWSFLFKNVYWLKFKYRICLSVLQTPYKPARARWICVLWINKNRRLNRTWYAAVDFIFQMINDSALILFFFQNCGFAMIPPIHTCRENTIRFVYYRLYFSASARICIDSTTNFFAITSNVKVLRTL